MYVIQSYASFLILSFATLFFTPILATDTAQSGIYCPPDAWISCGDEVWNLDQYGHATLQTYTGTTNVYATDTKYNLNDCGVGTIQRQFGAYDPYGEYHSCIQTIWVEPSYNRPISIDWPRDVTIAGCEASIHPNYLEEEGWPDIYTYGCSNLGTSYSDQVFDFGPGCSKIIRSWRIIDWCVYDPNYSQTRGIYNHAQIIKVSNVKEPDVTFPEDVTVTAYNCDDAYVALPEIQIDYAACGGAVEVSHNSSYADQYGSTIASGKYPVGTTTIRYKVSYGCGMELSHYVNVTVDNQLNPEPYCVTSLAVALMPVYQADDNYPSDGMVELWASDLNINSISPCNHGPLTFSFSEDASDTVREFTCADIGDNEMQMWVTDANGKSDYCTVSVSVQNNAAEIADCGDGTEVLAKFDANGTVTMYHDQKPIFNVEMQLANMDTDEYEMAPTSKDGKYKFEGLAQYGHYMLTPSKEKVFYKTTSKFDVEKLERHLSGQEVDNNPFFLLAADVDDSGTVDEQDLVILTEYESGERRKLPTATPWIFVESDYNFDKPAEPWNEAYSTQNEMINMVGTTTYTVDFVGVIKGQFTNLSDNISIGGRSNEANELTSLHVYPNPIVDRMYIDYDSNISTTGTFSIIDISGKRVVTHSIQVAIGQQTIELDASSLVDGAYIYEMIVDGKVSTGKIFK